MTGLNDVNNLSCRDVFSLPQHNNDTYIVSQRYIFLLKAIQFKVEITSAANRRRSKEETNQETTIAERNEKANEAPIIEERKEETLEETIIAERNEETKKERAIEETNEETDIKERNKETCEEIISRWTLSILEVCCCFCCFHTGASTLCKVHGDRQEEESRGALSLIEMGKIHEEEWLYAGEISDDKLISNRSVAYNCTCSSLKFCCQQIALSLLFLLTGGV